ncbi:hypothetical protein SprV_0401736200 [Sparganum proliferum]
MELQLEPHLGDDEMAIRPSIGVTHRLGHQHVLSIASPGKNIIQQLPRSRSAGHPGRILTCRQAEEGVGQEAEEEEEEEEEEEGEEALFCAGSQVKEVIADGSEQASSR